MARNLSLWMSEFGDSCGPKKCAGNVIDLCVCVCVCVCAFVC